MTEYFFKESFPPETFEYSYDPWLFHHPDHLLIQSPTGWVTFLAIHERRQHIEAYLPVHIADHTAVSPLRASFGSVQFDPALEPIVLYRFIEFILVKLKQKGVTSLILKNPPDQYQQAQAVLLNTFLFNLGFHVKEAEVGAMIGTNENFEEGLTPWETRKLKQARTEGLRFVIEKQEKLKTHYSFIAKCRKERDHALSMDWQTLDDTVTTFPDRFALFSVYEGKELAAASIAVKVSETVLYNFLSAHPHKYDHLSPVVLLLEGMHRYSIEHEFTYLDLGTSALEGQPNFSLLNFKLGLGATPTMKLTFRKTL